MTLSFIRSLFLIISGTVGYYIGLIQDVPMLGLQIGVLGGLLMIFFEMGTKRVSVRGLSSMVFGLVLGVLMAKLISGILRILPLSIFFHSVSEIVLMIVFSYLGSVMALRGKDEFNVIIPYVRFKRQDVGEQILLLDTSAIIDGRVMEIYKTHFIKDRLVIPRFVLQELHTMVDSKDDIKRERGRRGLDLLHAIQNDSKIDVRIHEDELEGAQDVDGKLIILAKGMDARICTTDFNLNRIASVQGIEVLNVNELASAMKSNVFVGEKMIVHLQKEGKETDQAVGHLDDGTMVVVTQGREMIGKDVDVVVSSVLQTQAGKMIFAKVAGK